jgi:hypothetical protein
VETQTKVSRFYERKLEQARADLSHINAVTRVFEAYGDPRDMLRYVLQTKRFDDSDAVLVRAVTQQLPQSLRMQEKHGRVKMAGKRMGFCLWARVDAR